MSWLSWLPGLRRFRFALFLIAQGALSTLAFAQFGTQNAVGSTVKTDQVRAELIAQAPDGVAPGRAVWVGLKLTHAPGWHTYWKNAGDSGLPTQLRWTLPKGVSAGAIAWPMPRRITVGPLVNYGYDGTVLLPVPLSVAPDFHAALLSRDLDVKLHASWLVCRTECIPQEGDFRLAIPLQGSTSLNRAAFDAARAAEPRPLPDSSQAEVAGNALKLRVAGLPAALVGKPLQVFPETPEVIDNAASVTQQSQQWQGDVWTASLPLARDRSASPARFPVVLAAADSDGAGAIGYRADAPISGVWPKVAPAAGVSPALAAALQSNAAGASAAPGIVQSAAAPVLFAALFGALLGGLLLNLMPCVFPVLAIKLLALTRHANDRRAHRVSAAFYTAGQLASFLALGALMLSLRAVGAQFGWGFQLQSPLVVALLAALFTVLGLNLAGLFEFGRFVPAGVAAAEARSPGVDAFLSGVLTVLIASPCTAPFMGAAVGLAVGLPAAQALAVFGAVGLGMALPYLAAALVPGFARLLPRPGAWMQVFRRLMAFPMFATVVWLVWVLGQQSGIDGAAALLALLVALGAVLWAATLAGRSRAVVAFISIASFAWLAVALGPNITKMPATGAVQAAADGPWQPWEPGRVEQVLASGRPVFVDFTAAWCVTCQYNKKTTLANQALLADLAAKHVVLLRADWTRQDPAIGAALRALGRNGVPAYVLYEAGRAPQLLSELPTVAEVRAAVARL